MSKKRPDRLKIRQTKAMEKLIEHMHSKHPHTEKTGALKSNMDVHEKELANLKRKLDIT